MTKNILVEIIPQLKDNYSYLVYSNVNKLGFVIDPPASRGYFQLLNISQNVLLEVKRSLQSVLGVLAFFDLKSLSERELVFQAANVND